MKWYSKVVLVGFIVAVWLQLSVDETGAAYGINRTINFQGKLVNTSGVNVPNATPVTATFRIYNSNTSCPGGGTPVWSENQTFTPIDGIFQVALGSVTGFGTSIDFSQDSLYLGIQISGETNEMCNGSSRIRLAAVPYAFNAESFAGLTADNNQTNYFTITGGQGTPATLRVNGNITVGSVIQPTSPGTLTVQSNGANSITLDSGTTGDVNIGTGSNAKTINIGTAAVANTIAIGSASATGVSITDNNWSIGVGGAASFTTLISSGAITANGGITTSTTNQALSFSANGSGDFVYTVDSDTNFQITAASTAPAVDMLRITNSGLGVTTTGVNGLAIDFVQGDDADATDTNSGLSINVTAASNDAGDVLAAMSLGVTTPTDNNREIGLSIGTGFDEDIFFASASARIRFQDGGEIKFTDGSMGGGPNKDFPQARLIEYFSTANYGVFEANGFINIDGGFFVDNFTGGKLQATADAAGSSRFGDGGNWVFDEGGAGGGVTVTASTKYGCTVTQNVGAGAGSNTQWGMLEMSPDISTHTHTAADATCVLHMGGGTGTATGGSLNAAKKYVQYFKVKPTANFTQAASARQMFVGAHNYTEAWGQNWGSINATHAFIGFANLVSTTTATDAQGGTQWNGFARVGNSMSSVTCGTNGNISTNTSAFALMRIEARATNDVHFFIDRDISDGVALSECGSGISSNISTRNLNPAMNVLQQQNLSGATNQWTMLVDFASFVYDDPRDGNGSQAASSQTEVTSFEAPQAPVYDYISGADLAEYYIFENGFEKISWGDLVVLGDKPGEAKVASREYQGTLIGVISTSPGLTMGQTEGKNVIPVALTGRVKARVSTTNGPIKVGDPITSSAVEGVGQKATRSGRIVGLAMESLDEGEGQIMIKVNPGFYLVDDNFELVDVPAEKTLQGRVAGIKIDIDKQREDLLSQVNTEKSRRELIKDPESIRAVVADKVVAGLEVVAPAVTAEEVVVGKIKAMSGKNLRWETDGGIFEMDASGSAFLSGALSADSIRARKIEGMEMWSQKFASLEDKLASMSAVESVFKRVKMESGLVSLDLTVLGDLIANNNLNVKGSAEFGGRTTFQNEVIFEGSLLFNNSTGGFAAIPKGADRVEVKYDKPYRAVPVVAVTMDIDKTDNETGDKEKEAHWLSRDYSFVVARKSSSGFVILLNKPAEAEVNFSWSAMLVREPRRSLGILPEILNLPSLTPTPTLEVLVQPTPTLIPEASPSGTIDSPD